MPPRTEEEPVQTPPYHEDADSEREEGSDEEGEVARMLSTLDGSGPEVEAAPGAALSHPREEEDLLKPPEKPKPIAWRDLPQKQQLLVITLTRLSEPLVQTSLQVCPHSDPAALISHLT